VKQWTKSISNAARLLRNDEGGITMRTVHIDTYRRSLDPTSVGIDVLTRYQRVAEVSALLERIAGQPTSRQFGTDLPHELRRALDAWLEPRIAH
jgi:hypothetical protein